MPDRPPSAYGSEGKPSEYRIRWAIVTIGRTKARMCIAERRVRFLIFISWWPIGDWRYSEAEARRDAEYDIALRKPLPQPITF